MLPIIKSSFLLHDQKLKVDTMQRFKVLFEMRFLKIQFFLFVVFGFEKFQKFISSFHDTVHKNGLLAPNEKVKIY